MARFLPEDLRNPRRRGLMHNPELSVIVVVASNSKHLKRCLISLYKQVDPPSMEIIVPYEANTLDTSAFQSRFPIIQFHEITSLRQ
jgi:GT2 family glycosyltransferase